MLRQVETGGIISKINTIQPTESRCLELQVQFKTCPTRAESVLPGRGELLGGGSSVTTNTYDPGISLSGAKTHDSVRGTYHGLGLLNR